MVVRGRLAFDDQGRLVEIAEDAADPNNPTASEIDPVEFDELTAQTARPQNLDAGQLLSALDAAGYDISNVGNADTTSIENQDYNESVSTHASASGTVTLDLAAANVHRVEATGDVTIAFSNTTGTPPGNSIIVYLLDGDGTGPHAVSWPASVVWNGGTAQTEIAANSNFEVSLLTDDGGTEWRGRLSGEAFA